MTENKQPRRLSTSQNMLFNTVGSLFYLVCQWLLSVVVVRLGSFDAAGVLSLAMYITNVFFTVSTFGIRIFQVSDTQGQYTAGRYISTRLLTCALGWTLCMAFVVCNGQYSLTQISCVVVYMLFRVGEALVDVLAGEEQKAYRFDYVGKSFLLRGALLLGSFTLTLALGGSLLLAISLMAAATLAAGLLFDGRVVRRLTDFRLDFSVKKSLPLLKEAWPLMLNAMLLTMLASIPKYFLQTTAGDAVAGIYNSIATPAVIIQAGCSFIYTPLVAPLSEKYLGRDYRGYKRLALRAVAGIGGFALCMFAGAAVLGNWGLTLLFGEEILPYAPLLLPVLLCTLCMALVYFCDVLLTIARRLKTMTVIHAAAIALTAILSAALVPAYGMEGVNLTIILCAGGDALAMGAVTVWDCMQKKRCG